MMSAPFHPLNWYAGWTLLFSAFITGALIGLRFADPAFWGGYTSFRRRIARLGHVAQAALGMLNVLFSMSPWPTPGTPLSAVAEVAFVVGGLAMPAVCFLTAWRPGFRTLFFVPVLSLSAAAACTLLGGGT